MRADWANLPKVCEQCLTGAKATQRAGKEARGLQQGPRWQVGPVVGAWLESRPRTSPRVQSGKKQEA